MWLTGSRWQRTGSCSGARRRRSGEPTPVLVGNQDILKTSGEMPFLSAAAGFLGTLGTAQAADADVHYVTRGQLAPQEAVEGVCLILCQYSLVHDNR